MSKEPDVIPMDPICPRCGGKHGVEVSGDGYEWDCAACGGHLMCAIGPDGGEMYPYHREDGTCGCASELHTCEMDEGERAELLADATKDERWEPLDARARMFGVFATESYSSDPVAVFSTKQDAANWLAWQEQIGDESTLGGCDYCICPVELSGRVWNSHDDIPENG